MSTDIGEVEDALDPMLKIEVAIGTGGIRLFSSERKIWLDKKQAGRLVVLLETARSYLGDE